MKFNTLFIIIAIYLVPTIGIANPIGTLSLNAGAVPTWTSGNTSYINLDTYQAFTFADVVNAINTPLTNPDLAGYSIANTAIALQYTQAILGSESMSNCSSEETKEQSCGQLTGWVDGALGDSFDQFFDKFFYLNGNIPPMHDVGLGSIYDSGVVKLEHNWSTISVSDIFSHTTANPNITWLLYKTASVTAPPLFGTMLFGLLGIGCSRLKKFRINSPNL